jgi:serine/tyrosine/threonine adenylyltransferase
LNSFSTADGADNSALGDLVVNRPLWEEWAPRYRARLRAEKSDDAERKGRMDRINPKFILRNYLAQQAIDAAHQRDYSEIDSLLKVLRNPFAEHPEFDRYAAPPPDWGRKLEVSCSS